MKCAAIALIEHLGDIIATEPIARYVKSQGYHVTWHVRKIYSELVSTNPAVDQVVEIASLRDWASINYESMFDAVFDLHFNRREDSVTKSPVEKRTGDKSIGLHNYFDNGRSLLGAFCAAANLPELSDAPKLHVPIGDPCLKKPYVVMHCSANEPDRRWTNPSWKMLAYDVVSAGFPVVEVGVPRILDGVRGIEDRTGILPISKLASIIAGASLFIGGDSGPAHIANACEVESAVILGGCRTWKRYNPYTGFFRNDVDRHVLSSGMATADIPYVLARGFVMNKIYNIVKGE